MAEAAGKEKSGFIWYELMTGDLDAAVAFYRDVVGWDIRDSGMPGMTYMIFGRDGKDVGGMMAWGSIGEHKPTQWVGHIMTPDVDAETAAVVADGGTQFRAPRDIPGIGRFSVVGDPQGVEYLLFQPNPTDTPPAPLVLSDIGAINWCELATTDWEKAWDFYAGHYGWTKDMAVDMGRMGLYQTFSAGRGPGGGMMNIPSLPGMPKGEPAWLFYVTVEDINVAVERVKASGGEITQPPMQVPGGSWTLKGTDPQGGRFALTAAK